MQFKTALDFHDIIKEKESTIEVLENRIVTLEMKLAEIKRIAYDPISDEVYWEILVKKMAEIREILKDVE